MIARRAAAALVSGGVVAIMLVGGRNTSAYPTLLQYGCPSGLPSAMLRRRALALHASLPHLAAREQPA